MKLKKSNHMLRLQGNTLQESLVNVENEHRMQDREILSVIDHEGKILMIKDGDTKSVGITAAEKAIMHDSILTHNHQESSCFSPEDIKAFVNSGASEMRATKRDGGFYSIKKMSTETNGHDLVRKYYRQNQRAVRNAQNKLDSLKFAEKIKSGEISQSYANKVMRENISHSNAKWLYFFAAHHGYIYFEV